MAIDKNHVILFIVDEKISRERAGVLVRMIHSLRRYFPIDIIQNAALTEAQVIKTIEEKQYSLLLAPLHKYQAWHKVEGYFGINRTSGPTFAGYFCQGILLDKFPSYNNHHRGIALDFAHLNTNDLCLVLRSLLYENRRAGIKPLLGDTTPIYCDQWFGKQGVGKRMDAILGLSEIAHTPWMKRAESIRILFSALWSLIYEEGPGKKESVATSTGKKPIAYFQVGADAFSLSFRLAYQPFPRKTPKDALAQFLPGAESPLRASQLLLRFSDFARIHTVIDTDEVEIVVSLLPSAPSEKSNHQVHTIWIDPISSKLIQEPFYETPSPANPRLWTLPNPMNDLKLQPASSKPGSPTEVQKEPKREVEFLGSTFGENERKGDEAHEEHEPQNDRAKIIELKRNLVSKEETIQESKSGEVNQSPHSPQLPDAESLLEAFQQKYFEASFQIRQFELQLLELEKKGGNNAHEQKTLRLKMEALINREKSWIKKLMDLIEMFQREESARKHP